MNRRMMMAALAAIGAASVTVAPTYAQDQSLLNAKMAPETAPVSSGVVPTPSVQLGTKRTATSQEGQQQGQKAARPLSLSSGAAPNLPVK